MSFFDEWERTAVYYKISSNNGSSKYTKAPFDLVRIGTEFGIEPQSGPGTDLRLWVNQSFPVEVASKDEEYIMAREEGFHNLKVIVIEPHEMGNPDLDNWVGMHKLSVI